MEKRKTRYVRLIPSHELLEVSLTKRQAGMQHICSWCGEKFHLRPTPTQTGYKIRGHERRWVCYECALGKVMERQRYGFWLRFASEHFIPCDQCQDLIHKMLYKTEEICFRKEYDAITLIITKNSEIKFRFEFIYRNPVFVPCKDCQKKVLKIWQTSEFHIGNDNKPLVEFWRDWYMVEE